MAYSMRVLVAAVALALLAAACGSGDEAEVGSAPVTSDDEGADGSTETTDDAGAAMTGDANSDWCQAMREVQESGDANPMDFGFTGLDPASMEAYFTGNLAMMDDWRNAAPPEIDQQVETMYGLYSSFVDLAEAAEWNVAVMGSDPEFMELVSDPAVEQAANDIDAYSRDVCGVDLITIETPGASVPAAGGGDASGLAQEFLGQFGLPPNFLTDQQLECLNGELAEAFPDGLPEDLALTAETVEVFDTAGAACGIGTP
jgi:hypothetical protein